MDSFATEREYHQNAATNLRTRLARIKALKEKAYEDRLQGFMDTGFIERQFSKWIEEENAIRYEIIKHDNANNDYLITGIKIMELAEKAYDLFQHMTTAEKKEMVKLVLSNPVIRDGSVCFSYQKPFNMIVDSPSCSVWLGDEDSNLG